MSSQAVKEILLRAIFDDEFSQAMLHDPQRALAEFEGQLTVMEWRGLLEGGADLLRLATPSPDAATPPIAFGLPRIMFMFKFYNHVGSPSYVQLETLADEKVQQAVWEINDVADSLNALQALEPAEREERIAGLLRRWEEPNARQEQGA
jgi:hypothetical protein